MATNNLDQSKENYYLQYRDIATMGAELISVGDDHRLFYVKIIDGEVQGIQGPDGKKDFDLDDINSQLKAGATLGAAITGEENKNVNTKLHEMIRKRVRSYLLSD